MNKVAIIVLLYNGKKYLPQLLNSLKKQKTDDLKVEIIVVDNKSTDDSLKYIQDNFPEITVIENEKNFGFAEGNNIGMRYALERGFDFIALLNQDVIVEENWLIQLIDNFKNNENVGAVQPKIMYWPEIDKINSYGNVLHYLGFGFTGFNGKNENEVENYPELINYASGAAVVFRSSILKKIGLFDKSFFMYHEDTDLSLRIKFAGYQIKLVPQAKVYHQYKFSKSIRKFYYIERNRFILLLKFYKLLTLLLILPALIFLEIGLLIQSIFNGFIIQRIKVYLYLINPLNLRQVIKKRIVIQKQRIIKDKNLIKELSAKIEFQEIDNFFLRYIFNPILNFYKKLIEKIIFW